MGKWLILPSACATSARAPGTNSNTQKTTAPPRHPGKMPKKSIAFKWGFEPVPVRQQRRAFSLAPLVTACRPYLRDEDRSATQAKRETLRDALWRLAPARNNKTTGPSQPRGAPKGKRPRQNAKKKSRPRFGVKRGFEPLPLQVRQQRLFPLRHWFSKGDAPSEILRI